MADLPDPDADVQALLEEGATLYESGKLYEALAAWKEALVLDPGNEIALEYLQFVEDNFQIGVDALLAHHQAQSGAAPPPPPPVAPASDASAADQTAFDAPPEPLFDDVPVVADPASVAPPPLIDDPPEPESAASTAEPQAFDAIDEAAPLPPVLGEDELDEAPDYDVSTAESLLDAVMPVDSGEDMQQQVAHPLTSQPPSGFPPASTSTPQDSIEEMDWSEILEDGVDEQISPPAADPDAAAENDEGFFVEMDSGQLDVEPGGEAAAWGVSRSPISAPIVPHLSSPTRDPFEMPPSHFVDISLEVVPPEDDDGEVPDTWAAANQRDLSDMSDNSIEIMLEEDFKIWEDVVEADPFAHEEADAWSDAADAFEPAAEQPADEAPSAGEPAADQESAADQPTVLTPVEPPPAAEAADSVDDAAQALGDAIEESLESLPLADEPEAEADEPVRAPADETLGPEDSVEIPIPAIDDARPRRTGPIASRPSVVVGQEAPPPVARHTPHSLPPLPEEPDPLDVLPSPLFELKGSAAGTDEQQQPPPVDWMSIDLDPPSMELAPPGDAATAFDSEEFEIPAVLGDGDEWQLDAETVDEALAMAESVLVETPDLGPTPATDFATAPTLAGEAPDETPAVSETAPAEELGRDASLSARPRPPDAPLRGAPVSATAPTEQLERDPSLSARSLPPDPPLRGAPVSATAPTEQLERNPSLAARPLPPDPPLRGAPVSATAPTEQLERDPSLAARPLPDDPPLPDEPAEPAAAAIFGRRRRGGRKGGRPERKRRTPTPPMPAPKPPESKPIDADLEALLRMGLEQLDAIESVETEEVRQRMPTPPPPDTDLASLMNQARQRQAAGDFSGSLELVDQVLQVEPDHAEAQAYLTENTTQLLFMYRSQLGPLTRIPRVRLRPEEIIWQALDHRAGFLLSQVDGRTSYEDLIEIAGMSELEATRVLARLVEYELIG